LRSGLTLPLPAPDLVGGTAVPGPTPERAAVPVDDGLLLDEDGDVALVLCGSSAVVAQPERPAAMASAANEIRLIIVGSLSLRETLKRS
jgi:hypothetical protein